MTPHKHHFHELQLQAGEQFATGSGLTQSHGIGSVKVSSFDGKQWNELFLNSVHYVPSLPCPLFSEPACKPEIRSNPNLGQLNLLFDSRSLFTDYRDPSALNVPYIMNLKVIPKPKTCGVMKLSEEVAHFRFGHCPPLIVNKTVELNLVNGISVLPSD